MFITHHQYFFFAQFTALQFSQKLLLITVWKVKFLFPNEKKKRSWRIHRVRTRSCRCIILSWNSFLGRQICHFPVHKLGDHMARVLQKKPRHLTLSNISNMLSSPHATNFMKRMFAFIFPLNWSNPDCQRAVACQSVHPLSNGRYTIWVLPTMRVFARILCHVVFNVWYSIVLLHIYIVYKDWTIFLNKTGNEWRRWRWSLGWCLSRG